MTDLNNMKAVFGEISKVKDNINIMEVCGTHTKAIFASGIQNLLPSNIKLISGPGCPICVTPQGTIDIAIEISKQKNIIITAFGDVMSIPGTFSSLKKEKINGSDIRVVFSPLHSLQIAKRNPDKEVIFIGIGFETTAPVIGLSINEASNNNIKNYSVLSCLKTMPNAIDYILKDEKINIHGMICPGHVSTIIGQPPFEFISVDYKIPAIIAGFESYDILAAIYLLIQMILKKKYEIKNIYERAVRYQGNKKAREMINKIFVISNSTWRGLGIIKDSGYLINSAYEGYDAIKKLNLNIIDMDDSNNKNCICGDILKGIKEPLECIYFLKECTPSNPIGPCMVSQEGTCYIYRRYMKN